MLIENASKAEKGAYTSVVFQVDDVKVSEREKHLVAKIIYPEEGLQYTEEGIEIEAVVEVVMYPKEGIQYPEEGKVVACLRNSIGKIKEGAVVEYMSDQKVWHRIHKKSSCCG